MPFELIKEKDKKHIEKLRKDIEGMYNKGKIASPENINYLKLEFSKIPKLVINFDETLTEKDTITEIFEELISRFPKRSEEFKIHKENLKQKYRHTKTNNKKGVDVFDTHVNYFYSEVLKGLAKDELIDIYRTVLERTKINPNFIDTLKALKEYGNYKMIPVLGLSINSRIIIEAFYEMHKETFAELRLELIGVIGNEIVFNEEGKVEGVLEHVRDFNKGDYIPEHALTLVDDRDTKNLLEMEQDFKSRWKINTVNIEGSKFDKEILLISIKISDILFNAIKHSNSEIIIKIKKLQQSNINFKKTLEGSEITEKDIYNFKIELLQFVDKIAILIKEENG